MKYGLIGEKLGHSWSCEIHRLIPADYEYELKELRPDEVGAFVSSRDFRAFNVTIPYKKTVIPFLDHLSEEAALTSPTRPTLARMSARGTEPLPSSTYCRSLYVNSTV